MPEYKIVALGTKPPKEWSFNDKKTGKAVDMLTYKVKIEGEDEPIDINRRPGNAPLLGEVLTGTLEETDFGRRFKAAPKQGSSFKDQSAIRAQWAIGQAINILTGVSIPEGKFDDPTIEATAKRLYAMVDRVKESSAASSKAEPSTGLSAEDESLINSTPPEFTDDF